jgi:lipopolysaccharide/colanic/teichoic acid biosynthesis glycosyltransferase
MDIVPMGRTVKMSVTELGEPIGLQPIQLAPNPSAAQRLVWPRLPRRRELTEISLPLLKRAIDIGVSAVVLMLLVPVIAVIALLIRLDSRGPVFYRCDRVGTGRRPLRMLKFRKMHDDAQGLALTMSDDDRFTRVGRVLAKYKLDEIPQFWHVLRGEMSLVGPRPESQEFVACFDTEYDTILRVRPGILGLSQLAFANESGVLDPEDPTGFYIRRILPQKVGIDRMYIERHTVGMDVRILLWSVAAIAMRRDVAVHRQTGRLTLRRR